MKLNRKNLLLLAASSLASFALTAPAAHGATMLWDATPGTSGAQDGNGTWQTGAGNWQNETTFTDNQTWSAPTADLAKFGAVADGTYAVTVSGAVVAGGGLSFAFSGYTLSGGTSISLDTGSANGNISLNTNKTATINTPLIGRNASSTVTLNAGSVLSLGGGFSTGQFKFTGAGTLNITGGTSSPAVPQFNCAVINQTAGTVNLGNANTAAIGYGSGRNVNYTISGTGIITVNNAGSGAGLVVGRALGSTHTATFTLQAGGTVNIGTTASQYGSLYLVSADGTSNSKLDVQDGALTVGTGQAVNKIVFFNNGSGASKTSTMQQSGGTVTANGIQFGNLAGTYDATSLATLKLAGGNLYVGTLGITRGANAATLPYSIQLQGGTLGASADWSSPLDMKLGTTGGGPTIKAANASDVAKNITLSGSIGNDTAVNGALTKTGGGTLTLSGAVSYSGATVVSAGKLVVPSTHTGTGTATVSANAALGVTAAGTSQWQPASLTLADPCTLDFNSVQNPGTTTAPLLPTAGVGTVSGVTVNLNSFSGAAGVGSSYPLLGNQGGTTTGYTLGTQAPGVTGHLDVSGTTLVYVVDTAADVWTGTDPNPTFWDISTSTNWTGKALSNAPVGSYADGDIVLFDDTAAPVSPVTVALQTPVAPGNLIFLNSTKDYIISASGTNVIGSGSLTKTGNGKLTLVGGGAHTYSGATTISAGTLQLGDGTTGNDTTIANSPSVVNNGAMIYNRFGPASEGYAISGNGTLTKSGAGTQTLSGLSATAANNYSGATTIGEGALAFTTTAPTFTGGLTFGSAVGSTVVGALDLSAAGATFGGAFLVRTNSATANTISIGSSQTLQLNGAVTVGYNSAARSTTTKLEVTGLGTLSIGTVGTPTNANIQIGNGTTAGVGNAATLDLSGLSALNAYLGSGTFRMGGVTGDSPLAACTVILAANSTIQAAALNVASQDSLVTHTFKLGSGTNVINVDTLNIAGLGGNTNNNGRASGNFSFNGATGTLKIRSQADPVNGRAILNVAHTAMGTANSPNGLFDTTGHAADLRFGLMTIGARTTNDAAGSNPVGEFKFDTGTLDADDLVVGIRNRAAATGIVTLNGGTITINALTAAIRLGSTANTVGTGSGTLNISGTAAVTVAAFSGNSIILGNAAFAGAAANGTLNLTGGTLTLAGDITRGATTGISTAVLNIDGASTVLDMGGNDITGLTGGAFTDGTVKNVGVVNSDLVMAGSGSRVIEQGVGVSGVIQGVVYGPGVGLTKTGLGTLTLSGANTYDGPTLVSLGKLVVASTQVGTGTATVSANATLGVTASGVSQWQPASLTLTDPCTLEFNNVQNPGTTTAPLLPTAAVGTVSGVTVNIGSISGIVLTGNSYPLLGNQDGTTSGYTLGTQPAYITGHLAVSGTTLVYVVDTAPDVWTGTDANPTWWDVGLTPNWNGGAATNTPTGSFANGDMVWFDDTASPVSPVTVELKTPVAPGNMYFANSAKAYLVSASGANVITSGSLTKSGTATVTLDSGAHTYGGATTISAGTLILNGSLTGGGAISTSGAGNLTQSATGVISGASTFTKSSTGTSTLGGDNAYTGATTLNLGTLSITHNNALGTTAGATTINGGNGSGANTLDLNSATTDLTVAEPINFNGNATGRAQLYNSSAQNHTLSGPIDVSSVTNLVQFSSNGTGSITISGDITGTLGTGATLMLRGNTSVNNKVTGNVNIVGEFVKTDSSTWTVGVAGKTYSWGNTRAANGILKMGTNNVLPSTTVVMMGNDTGGSTGSLDLNGFNQTIAGISYGGAGSSTGTRTITSTSAAVLTVNNATDYTATGSGANSVVLTGSLGLAKSGVGALTLVGVNTYSGNTTVNAGTLTLGNAASAADANTGNNASTVTIAATGATLNLTYTGTDKVDKLVIGTVQQVAGVYGHTSSGATNGGLGVGAMDAYFGPGAGTLTVASGPGFSSWIAGTFAGGATVPLDKRGPNDDPDNDGIRNLVEYAVAGQDPTVANPTIGTFTSATLSFTKRADASGLTYAIQDSTDLGLTDPWAEVPAGPSYTNNATTISYTLTPGTPPSNFIRLQVVQVP